MIGIPDVSWKFKIILTALTEVTPVLSVFHLRMRGGKIPYEFNDSDMGSYVAQEYLPFKFERLLAIFTVILGVSGPQRYITSK